MRAFGDTRVPNVSTTSPSTFTQPLVIQRSASRLEQRPSSPMRLERRGFSGFSGGEGGGGGLVVIPRNYSRRGLGQVNAYTSAHGRWTHTHPTGYPREADTAGGDC